MSQPPNTSDGNHSAESAQTAKAPIRRVLIADDHDDTRSMLRLVLELNGYMVSEATDGETVVKLTENERPDIVLMDFGLPILDGLGALQTIRGTAAISATPVIFLTGRAEPAPQKAAREHGCNGYLVKPVDLDKMLALIESSLA